MTKKALPKAITRTLDDLQVIGTSAVKDEQRKKPELVSVAASAKDEDAPTLNADSLSHSTDAVSATAVSTPPTAPDPLAPTPVKDDQLAVRRRAAARKIVERYRLCAAMGGLFPLPIVNVASVTAINMRMVKVLSDLYGVPFERDRTRSIVMGFVGGAAPSGFAAATASTLALVAPGAGFVGLAVSSFSAAAFTRGIGSFFIERFEGAA